MASFDGYSYSTIHHFGLNIFYSNETDRAFRILERIKYAAGAPDDFPLCHGAGARAAEEAGDSAGSRVPVRMYSVPVLVVGLAVGLGMLLAQDRTARHRPRQSRCRDGGAVRNRRRCRGGGRGQGDWHLNSGGLRAPLWHCQRSRGAHSDVHSSSRDMSHSTAYGLAIQPMLSQPNYDASSSTWRDS